VSKFEVGQRVRNIDPQWGPKVPVGSEGTVVAVDGRHYPVHVDWDALEDADENPWIHLEEEVEAVPVNPYDAIPIKVGETVETNEGVQFVVTEVIDAYDVDLPPEKVDEWGSFAVKGHPNGNYVWENFIDRVVTP
jgi:hypothetical protein